MKKRVFIIGSGFGGLSAAIHLATKGYDVTIFEKNDVPGGKAGRVNVNGFKFDLGPTLLTMPFVVENLFQISGKKLEDYVKIKKKDIVCRYFFPDGSIFNEHSDKERLLNEFEAFTSEKKENLEYYLEYTKQIYELTADLFLFNTFMDWNNLFKPKHIKTLFNINKIDPFRSVHNANSSFFKSQNIIQLFDRYATYNGSNPYKAPATLNIIPFVELEFGGYYVEGGISKLAFALADLAECLGVKIFYKTKVDKILTSGKIVNGVQIGNEKIKSDFVVSNVDLYHTYKTLIGDTSSKEAKRYIKQELSTSALIFLMGVKAIKNKLEMDNILFSANYEKEFHQFFSEKVIPDDPTIHIHISSKKNNTDAPMGFENWYVMINAPTKENLEIDLPKIQKKIFGKIKKLTGFDLENHLEFITYRTPSDIEKQTSSYLGCLYGPSSNSLFSAFLRQKNRSRNYDGLYFAGGTVHPGGGVPLVILSGKIVSTLIQSNS